MQDVNRLDCSRIAQDLQIRKVQVENIVQLLDEGNTIPFITRYRKEQTGGLAEEILRQIQVRINLQRQLADRKKTILKSIENQGRLSDDLRDQIIKADTSKRLDDLYLPFKPKKRTAATTAREKGLEPLAIAIWNRDPAVSNLEEILQTMVDPDKKLNTPDDVLAGVVNILEEIISESADVRAAVRFTTWQTSNITSHRQEKLAPERGQIYKEYFDFKESAQKIPPHRILAINRGEREGVLKVKLEMDEEKVRTNALEALAKHCWNQAKTGQLQLPSTATSPPPLVKTPPPAKKEDKPAEEQKLKAEEKSSAEEKAASIESPQTSPDPTPVPPYCPDESSEEGKDSSTVPGLNGSETTTSTEPTPDSSVGENGNAPASQQPPETPSSETTEPETPAETVSSDMPQEQEEKPPKAVSASETKSEEPPNLEDTQTETPPQASETPAGDLPSATPTSPEGIPGLQVPVENEGELLFPECEFRTPHANLLQTALDGALNRLIQPSIEKEIRKELREEAEAHANQVFASNLRSLLMQHPVHNRRVLAIDPGFRTGCKIAALDETGNLLDHTVIYPHPPVKKNKAKKAAKEKVKDKKAEEKPPHNKKEDAGAASPSEDNTSIQTSTESPEAETTGQSATPPEVTTDSASSNSSTPSNPNVKASQENPTQSENPTLNPGESSPQPIETSETTAGAAPETSETSLPQDKNPETTQSGSEAAPETSETKSNQDGNPETNDSGSEGEAGDSEPPTGNSEEEKKDSTPPEANGEISSEATETESPPQTGTEVKPSAENPPSEQAAQQEEKVSQGEGEKVEDKPEEPDTRQIAKEALQEIVAKHNLNVVAIGNGTACRETEELIAELIAEKCPDLEYVVVNEAGASVYAASSTAKEEFPDFDAALRGTISIGRRLQDPLAELVKIEPQHIGVGLYQHDVNHKNLKETLEGVVEFCVNQVGVNLNTGNVPLLRYIAGLNQLVAREIVDFRSKNGSFPNREALLKVPNFGNPRYTQAAGFLRVNNGDNPLDLTWIHPESYELVNRLLGELGFDANVLRDADRKKELDAKLKSLSPHEIANKLEASEGTIQDIIEFLLYPGKDPREELTPPVFRKGIIKLEDLTPEMELKGTVLNVVDFGVFVDIGLKDSGLVHISQMANRFIKNPYDIVAVGDVVTVWVLKVDQERRHVSLTMIKPGTEKKQERRGGDRPPRRRPPRRQPAGQGQDQAVSAPGDSGQRSGPPPRRGDHPRDRRGHGRPPAEREAAAGSGRPAPPPRPPRKPRREPPKPKLTKEALEGKESLRSFSELSAFFAAKDKKEEPPKEKSKHKKDKKREEKSTADRQDESTDASVTAEQPQTSPETSETPEQPQIPVVETSPQESSPAETPNEPESVPESSSTPEAERQPEQPETKAEEPTSITADESTPIVEPQTPNEENSEQPSVQAEEKNQELSNSDTASDISSQPSDSETESAITRENAKQNGDENSQETKKDDVPAKSHQ